MDLKSKKEKLKKSLTSAKETIEKINELKNRQANEMEAKAQKAENLMKTNFKHSQGVKSMDIKQLKSDLALVKNLAAITGKSPDEIAQQYFVEKATETTAEHTAILNNVKSSDLIISFDERDAEMNLLNRFRRIDLNGVNKLEIPVDDENFEIQDTAQGSDAPEATWDESLISIEASRASLAFLVTQELQNKTIVDQLAYLRSKISLAVGRGLLEGIFNGQGANSAQQDNGYSSTTKTGKKYPGLRAVLSAASKVHDFGAAAIDRDKMAAFLKAAGTLFAQRQSQYIMILVLRDHQVVSDLVRGSGVTGVNPTKADDALYASRFMGVELHQTAFLKSPVASGSGYDATGFVSATGADNDHSVVLLINPSKVMYAIDNLSVTQEFKPRKNMFEVVVNCQIGWSFHTAELGLMGINVGADIT